MKIKMFGKKSVSALLFWIVVICLVGVLGLTINYIPKLLDLNRSLALLNLQPLLNYLLLLIPLALLFYTFQRKTLFSKQSIKYLNVFAVCNLVAAAYNLYAALSFFEMGFLEAFFLHSFSNLVLMVFALILAAVFKEGFTIQTENDLTI
jgi:hypothetical protein